MFSNALYMKMEFVSSTGLRVSLISNSSTFCRVSAMIVFADGMCEKKSSLALFVIGSIKVLEQVLDQLILDDFWNYW